MTSFSRVCSGSSRRTLPRWPRPVVSPAVSSCGKLFFDIGQPALYAEVDHVIVFGNSDLISDMRTILRECGFEESTSGVPAESVIEKAFVEK